MGHRQDICRERSWRLIWRRFWEKLLSACKSSWWKTSIHAQESFWWCSILISRSALPELESQSTWRTTRSSTQSCSNRSHLSRSYFSHPVHFYYPTNCSDLLWLSSLWGGQIHKETISAYKTCRLILSKRAWYKMCIPYIYIWTLVHNYSESYNQ